MAKLVCGCGYLGMRVARLWRSEKQEVWATTRSPERAIEFKSLGIHPLLVDIAVPFVFPESIAAFDTVLFAVGFDRSASHSLEQVYVGGLRHVLTALKNPPARFVYISSTGVYGPCDGQWVDEASSCHPDRAGGRACLAAEELLAAHPVTDRRIVLRLAGLYGPGRLPKADDIRQGHPIAAPEQGFLNLIHVDDAADIVLAVERSVSPPALFAVSDGHPVLRTEFYGELARLLRAPTPRFLPHSPSAPHRERTGSDKRVDSRRLHAELARPLRYPTYREGLRAIVSLSAG